MVKQWLPRGVSRATWAEISDDHLWGARHLAELAEREEEDAEIGAQHESYRRHRSYVVTSLLSSVCYLESAINETFSDCAEHGHSDVVPACDSQHRDALGEIWSGGIERLSTLDKYDLALAAGVRPRFPKDHRCYGDVRLLLKLRNALVHYKPEWVYGADEGPLPDEAMHKFERSLGRKFAENPLAGPRYPFWPDRCLSAACARWAIGSVDDFVGRFRDLMNPKLDQPPSR